MFGRNPRTAASLLMVIIKFVGGHPCHDSEYQIEQRCCSKCSSGNRVHLDCIEDGNTSCLPCTEGTFMNEWTSRRQCFTCSNCDAGSGLKIHTACTTTSDTVCEPLEGFYCLEPTESSCMTARNHTRCKPGQYISQEGTAVTDTVCSECSDGTFSDGTLTSCWTHTQCGPLEIKPGTASTDAECGEQSSNTTNVVGVVVGIVVLLFLSCGAAVFVFFIKIKRRKGDTKSNPDVIMEPQPEKDPLRTTDGDRQ